MSGQRVCVKGFYRRIERRVIDNTTKRLYCKFMKSRELIKLLKDNGWVQARIEGSHHIFTKAGRRAVPVPVHGGQDVPKGLAHKILKEAGIK